MFLFLVSVCAVVSCVILIVFLKFSTDKQHQQQCSEQLIDSINFLRAVKSTQPFPVSARYGWKVFCFCNNTRIWKRNLIVDNSGTRIQVLACFVKVTAPVQVVAKALKDVTRFVEWRPGFESSSHCQNGSSKQHGCLSHDFINVVTANQKLSIYSIVVEQKNIERYWKREDNGCFWLLESSESGLLFYILQPVEDLDKCCLTLVSHSVFPVKVHDSAVTMSSYAQSIRDYMLYRKMKVTPLLNIHIPQTKTDEKLPIGLTDDKPIVLSSVTDDLTDSSQPTSSDDENSTDQFHKKFAVLNPVEKSMVLEKSNFILHPQTKVRLRSQSDTNTSDDKMDGVVKQRSATLPKDIMSSKSPENYNNNANSHSDVRRRTNTRDLDQRFDDDVFLKNSPKLVKNINTQNDRTCLPKSDNTPSTVITNDTPLKNGAKNNLQNVPCINHNHKSLNHGMLELSQQNSSKGFKDDQEDKISTGSSQVIDGQSSNDEVESENQKEEKVDTDKSSPENITHITLANQCAAELLREYLQVSNLDLKKTTSQQSGSWVFCGLENDVVILKKTEGSSVISYMGKGLINASPQTVMETVKNPRTKFTYDETLKKVDILNDITDKIKIVYFYHEVISVFKKNCYDFCVLQSERQDGDKYVLANISVDTGLPNPAGVHRAQMLPSGWVIEPVQKEKKMYSMATYVIQVDFGMPTSNLDKTAVEELVSKQALSIAFLRQFLIPAKWRSRQQSSPVPRQQSTQFQNQQSPSVPRHQSSK